jgi:hypothetical protein
MAKIKTHWPHRDRDNDKEKNVMTRQVFWTRTVKGKGTRKETVNRDTVIKGTVHRDGYGLKGSHSEDLD